MCIESGCYVFSMTDNYGDGWNGATYTDDADSMLVASGDLDSTEPATAPLWAQIRSIRRRRLWIGLRRPDRVQLRRVCDLGQRHMQLRLQRLHRPRGATTTPTPRWTTVRASWKEWP